jgi:hypothetical protein
MASGQPGWQGRMWQKLMDKRHSLHSQLDDRRLTTYARKEIYRQINDVARTMHNLNLKEFNDGL